MECMHGDNYPLHARKTGTAVWCALLGLLLPWAPMGWSQAEALPNWIGSSFMGRGNRDDKSLYAGRSFEVPNQFREAFLRVVAADRGFVQVYLNGDVVIELEPFEPVRLIDVRPHLKAGSANQIAVRLQSSKVALELTVDGKSVVKSGAGWQSTEVPVKDWPEGKIPKKKAGEDAPQLQPMIQVEYPVKSVRWSLDQLPEISALDEYNQWKEALEGEVDTIEFSKLPPGFELEMLRSAQEDEGSWVSMEFDSRGRLIIAREQKGLLLLTVPQAGEEDKEIQVKVVEDTLEECRGLLWAYDSLYVNANDSKGLYRLRDTNGDDLFDEVSLLKSTEGKVGHGRNDLALGPDGMIYAIQGDSVELPEGAVLHTSEEPEGAPPQGYVMRTDKDGKTWEVLCRGLRNPYGIAFNLDGEMFTFDADNEGDVGLPFYRPTRVNHLVSGANYGWQQAASGHSWPVYAPDSLPTTFDIGRGSPTAVKFGTRSHFPEKYRRSLFVLDWAYGRIITVRLNVRGASYKGSGETFLRGRPLNVTDLDFGPDGAMYFVTGGRKTQSALYRVSYNKEIVPEFGAPPAMTARQALRRELEDLHTAEPSLEVAKRAYSYLGHIDPWIRNAARVALENQPVDVWRDKFLAENPKAKVDPMEPKWKPFALDLVIDRGGSKGPLQTLTALMTLARAGTDADRKTVAQLTSELKLPDLRRTEKLTLLRIYELCRPEPGSTSALQAIEQVEALYPDLSGDVNRELARILVLLEAPDAVGKTMNLLAGSTSQKDRLHYLDVLGHANSGWSAEQRQEFFQSLAHAKRLSKGDRFMPNFFQEIEENALSHVPEDERPNFASLLAGEVVSPVDIPEFPPRKPVKNWSLEDFAEVLHESGNRTVDLERGAQLFHQGQCSRCHQFGAIGIPAGPNLGLVSRRFGREDLLRAILEPSYVVAEIYRNVVITKTDGAVVMGRVIHENFRESTLSLAPNPFDLTELVEVAKADIDTYEESPVSPMPPQLLNVFEKDEVLDLLAYLEAGAAESEP